MQVPLAVMLDMNVSITVLLLDMLCRHVVADE
jgi:hypothetical protein